MVVAVAVAVVAVAVVVVVVVVVVLQGWLIRLDGQERGGESNTTCKSSTAKHTYVKHTYAKAPPPQHQSTTPGVCSK